MSEPDEFDALLAELRTLVKLARTRSDQHDLKKSTLPHYWNGVKVGYEDSANRLEALLNKHHPLERDKGHSL
nr:hypothetical protein [uncultured bacterium]